jgi:hypothetical protein
LTGRKGHPRVPHAAFNLDTQEARRSIRKLAALRAGGGLAGPRRAVEGRRRRAARRGRGDDLMGRRSRGKAAKLTAPTSTYEAGDGQLELRGVLKPRTRRQYADVLAGRDRPAATIDDAWQRAVEFLFERLAVRWTIGGVEYSDQRELLARLRASTADERRAVRDALRAHCAEWFPDLEAP